MPRLILLADEFPPSERNDLVERLGIPLGNGSSEHTVAVGRAVGGGVELRLAGGGTTRIELVSRPRGRERSPLLRALGIGRGAPPARVVDGTAGLGRDAAEILAAGCSVTLVERERWLAGLLAFEIARTGLGEVASCRHGDAAAELGRLEARPEAVYLDPMFPPTGKAALPKIEAQILRAACGDDDHPRDDAGLLAAAREAATGRVVVKRHPHAPPLAGVDAPNQVRSKSVRFDIYPPA